ncbi:hypothetical protein H1Q59_02960 [Holosporaceae bacterium 'Namur']|nr:hypothetical protein [Holosporaceae bacterium 'Namur']
MTESISRKLAKEAFREKEILHHSEHFLSRFALICTERYQLHSNPPALKIEFDEFFNEARSSIKGKLSEDDLKKIKKTYGLDFGKFKDSVQLDVNSLDEEYDKFKDSFKDLNKNKSLYKDWWKIFCENRLANMHDEYICEDDFFNFATDFLE